MDELYEDLDSTEEPSTPIEPKEKVVTGAVRMQAQIKALQDSLARRSQMPFDPRFL